MSGLRIGHAERDAALSALGEHFAQGRLDQDEYDERADAVWTARTAADLAPLFADLPHGSPLGPAPAAFPAPAPAGRGGRGGALRRGFSGLPTPLQVVLVLVAAGLVVAHLPVILLGLVLWFVLARKGVVGHPPWVRHRSTRTV